MTHSQISIAGTNDNGDPDFFLDFYIPLSSLGDGITASTPLRFNATTVMSGQAAIGGPKSDIYGLNDDGYKSTNTQWEAYINQQPPITLTSLSGTGTTPTSTQACTSAPTITSITNTGGTNSTGQVTGTWTSLTTSPQTTAIITVYLNGSTSPLTGTASATSGTTWTFNMPTGVSLASGNILVAKAQASGESMCLNSNTFTIAACSNWSTSGLVAPISTSTGNDYSCFMSATYNTSTKGVGATNRSSAAWTVYVNEAVGGTTRNSVSHQGSTGFSNNGTTTFTPSVTGNWFYSHGCQTGSPLTNGTYLFWYQDANGCKSDVTPICIGLTQLAAAPTVSPTNVTATTNTVTVTGLAGTVIDLYANGVVIASGTIAGTFNNSTTGAITFNNLTFSANGVVSATSKRVISGTTTGSYCIAKSAAQIVGLCSTTAPVIDADGNGQITAGQPITGGSSEPEGTTIRVYNSGNILLATTTVQSNGSWTTSGATFSNSFTGNAVAGIIYYATAQNGTCIVSAASGTFTAATATTNICGTITSTVDESTTTVSGTLSATPVATTTINLYQDGVYVANTTTTITTWTISGIPVGTFNPNSILTIGIRQGSNQEVLCADTRKVICASQPTAPTIADQANPAITQNSTVTYTLSGITSGNFYGIADANSGRSLADGIWAASNDNISITTYPFTGNTGTAYNVQIKVSSVSSSAVCTNMALSSVTITSTLPATFLSISALKVSSGVQVDWRVTAEKGGGIILLKGVVIVRIFWKPGE